MTARRYPTRRPTPDPDRGTDWRDHAACRGHEDLHDAAMPSQPWGPPMDRDAAEAALHLCAGCPVRDVCLAKLGEDPWVIAGGTTPHERYGTPEPDPGSGDHACPGCGKHYTTMHGLARHWTGKHRADTGRCVRGHASKAGTCQGCTDEAQARAHARRPTTRRGRRKETAA